MGNEGAKDKGFNYVKVGTSDEGAKDKKFENMKAKTSGI